MVSPHSNWLSQRERGSRLGMRLVFGIARKLGRPATRLLAPPIALYFALFDRSAKLATRRWLQRVHQKQARWSDIYRQFLRFTHVAIDRIFLLQGEIEAFEVTRTGNHHLEKLSAEKQGAILLGAHLGSFEAMRAGARQEHFPLYIVGNFENAQMINDFLSRLNKHNRARVLSVGSDPVNFALKAKAKVQEGAVLAILADRVGPKERYVEAMFFGQKARFPRGPFILAATLKCPVYLVFGLYREPNRYDLFCEPFATRVDLPRKSRQQALEATVQRYASRLEEYGQMAPDNWFNFFDFWGEHHRP